MISVLVVSTGDCNLSCCIVGVQVDLARLVPILGPFPRLIDTVIHNVLPLNNTLYFIQ